MQRKAVHRVFVINSFCFARRFAVLFQGGHGGSECQERSTMSTSPLEQIAGRRTLATRSILTGMVEVEATGGEVGGAIVMEGVAAGTAEGECCRTGLLDRRVLGKYAERRVFSAIRCSWRGEGPR